jgi:hypothetical protein
MVQNLFVRILLRATVGKTFSSSLLVELFCGVGIEAFWNSKLLFNESNKCSFSNDLEGAYMT